MERLRLLRRDEFVADPNLYPPKSWVGMDDVWRTSLGSQRGHMAQVVCNNAVTGPPQQAL